MTTSMWIAALTASALLAGCADAAPFDDARTRDVVIDAGDVTLGATLYVPADAGDAPLPAFVIAHGSAPSDRDGVGYYTNLALTLGFAVVSFDKRGVGESTGEYVPFSVATSAETFDALAEDVAAAARWLAEQPEVDARRIGALGGSQAGWIMPLAADKEPLISFIVIGEGVPVAAGEEDVHSGISGDGAWDERAVAQADLALIEFDGPRGYDPAPVLKRLDVPVLWIFGLRDAVIPVTRSLAVLEDIIGDGRTNHTVHVFPYGDHNFTNTSTGERYDLAVVARDWLIDIGVIEEPARGAR